MKQSLVIFLAVVAVASATRYPNDLGQKLFAHLLDLSDKQPDVYENNNVEPHGIDLSNIEDPENLGLLLNGEGKKVVEGVLAQMPCGWPELGIPPLAPYRQEEVTIHLRKYFLETLTKFIRFRVDGLDDMKINKLKISYTFSKKVKYNFTFPRIVISGKYVTDTLANLMQEYGISIEYDGKGDFVIVLENLTVAGQFKYKMPFLFGSIKIYKFECAVTLGNCVSHITGLMGNGRANHVINDEIEETVLWAVNGNQNAISTKIEEIIVPNINEKLKGHKVWYLLGSFGGGSGSPCVAPPDPWA